MESMGISRGISDAPEGDTVYDPAVAVDAARASLPETSRAPGVVRVSEPETLRAPGVVRAFEPEAPDSAVASVASVEPAGVAVLSILLPEISTGAVSDA